MALTITFTDGKEYRWNVGVTEDKGSLHLFQIGEGVRFLTAYGHEKEYIENRFKNIPTYNGRFCTWNGDMATFIAVNLAYEIFTL